MHIRIFGNACLLLASAAAPCITPASHAQQPGGYDFSLEQQPLGEALTAIGQAAGREIMFSMGDVAGRRAPAIKGHLALDVALETALKGSGLTAIIRPDVILIRAAETGSRDVANDPDRTEIVVTGSRVRGAVPASVVIVKTRAQIENAGYNNLGEFTKTLTQNFGGGQNPGVSDSQSDRSVNLNNSATLNLRGLGSDSTLTLINGHRVAYDGLFQGIDIGTIPVAALDRLEIVADGASAIYGSDAIGGVANIILRRDFSGLSTTARLGTSTDGGNSQDQYSAVTGSRWVDGGFLVTGDYSHSDAILAGDRSYSGPVNPFQPLVPGATQASLILAGHQDLSDRIIFELDGQYAHRTSRNAFPFSLTDSPYVEGNNTTSKLTSWALSPSLKFNLGRDWQASVSGTYGESNTHVLARIFLSGSEATRVNLNYDNDIKAVEASAEGPLFSLTGGELRLALGGGYRSTTLAVDIKLTPNGGNTITTQQTGGSLDVGFGYGELSLPLVGSTNASPLLRGLVINAALRYEKYRKIGDIAAPKIGLIYKPASDITLRGNWGRSFKAPTLYQSYEPRYGNYSAGSSYINFPAEQGVLFIGGGNSALKPERADSWSVSAAFEPAAAPGLKLEASYYDIRVRDRVVAPLISSPNAFNDARNGPTAIRNPTADQLAAAIASVPGVIGNFSGWPVGSFVVGGLLDGTLRNAARETVRGIDLSLSYLLSVGGEQSIEFTGSATYQDRDRQVSADNAVVQLGGRIFYPPSWRGRLGAVYERPGVTLSTFANYTGGTLDARFEPHVRVGSFLSFDAVARVRPEGLKGLFGGIDATFAVLNILNEKPSMIRNLSTGVPSYDTANYPATGRTISLTLTKSW